MVNRLGSTILYPTMIQMESPGNSSLMEKCAAGDDTFDPDITGIGVCVSTHFKVRWVGLDQWTNLVLVGRRIFPCLGDNVAYSVPYRILR